VYLGDGFLGAPLTVMPVSDIGELGLLPGLWAKVLTALALFCLVASLLLCVVTLVGVPLLLGMLTLPTCLCLLALLKPAYGATASSSSRVLSVDSVTDVLPHVSVRESFDNAQAFALTLNGAWVVSLWLLWVSERSASGVSINGWNDAMRSRLESEGIVEERFGEHTETAMLLLWMSPAIVGMVLWIFALATAFVSLLQWRLTDSGVVVNQTLSEADKCRIKTLASSFRLLVCFFVFIFGSLWVAASIVGSSLRLASVVQTFVAGIGSFIAIYIYLSLSSVDRDLLMRGIAASPLMRVGRNTLQSDWSKAALLSLISGIFWVYLILSSINQLVRRCRGRSAGSGCLTARTQRQIERMYFYTWTSVLRKSQMLCMAGVSLFVFGGVGTNIVLAFVNTRLRNTDFLAVSVIYFFVGLGMFLIPVVPGVAVYLFGGLLIPAAYVRSHGAEGDFTGSAFWVGTIVAVVLNFLLKMAAIALEQKAIGEPLSTNLHVLQFCGVNKPEMKAIEYILRKPGLSCAKVLVLIGGPDWPVSVLTGILRLPLCKMLFGSVPVVFAVVSVTLAGSFRLRRAESETWYAVSNVTLALASVYNVGIMMLVAYYVLDTWETHYDQLSQPKREHAVLDWLDHVAKQHKLIIDDVSSWGRLPFCLKATTVLGCASMVAASFLMLCVPELCWHDFEVTDPIDELGLDFFSPLGWGALTAFFVGAMQFGYFSMWLNCATKERCALISSRLAPERDLWIRQRLEACENFPDIASRQSTHESSLTSQVSCAQCVAQQDVAADMQEFAMKLHLAVDQMSREVDSFGRRLYAVESLGRRAHPDGASSTDLVLGTLVVGMRNEIDELRNQVCTLAQSDGRRTRARARCATMPAMEGHLHGFRHGVCAAMEVDNELVGKRRASSDCGEDLIRMGHAKSDTAVLNAAAGSLRERRGLGRTCELQTLEVPGTPAPSLSSSMRVDVGSYMPADGGDGTGGTGALGPVFAVVSGTGALGSSCRLAADGTSTGFAAGPWSSSAAPPPSDAAPCNVVPCGPVDMPGTVPRPPPDGSSPTSDWECGFDAALGRMFFYNNARGVWQWAPEAGEPQASAAAMAPPEVLETSCGERIALLT